MRFKYVNYGKTVSHADGMIERMDVSIEIEPDDFEDQAILQAKEFVEMHMRERIALKPKGKPYDYE